MQYLLTPCSSSFLQPYALHHHPHLLHKVRRPGLLKPHCSQGQQSLRTTSWSQVSLSLFGTGFLFGPLIDGLHSRVNLVVYKSGSIDIGPLHTNIWVGFNLNSLHNFMCPSVCSFHIYHIIDLSVFDIDRFLSCWGCFTVRLVCFNST